MSSAVAVASSDGQPSMSDMMAAAKPASLNTSEPLYATCTACHGENGEGKQWLGAPRISGQHDWYLERQLKNWQDGIRGTHPKDMYGIQMRSMSMTMATDDEIKKVVSYIGKLDSPKPAVTITANIQKGKELYGTCSACHGAGGLGNKALNSPKIAGLPDWYVSRQLWGFKKGLRGENSRDIYGQQMRPMAMALPDEEAINNLSAYIATFDGKADAPTIASAQLDVDSNGTSKNEIDKQARIVVKTSNESSVKAGAALYTTCIACHGADGAGNQALNSPRLAGQSSWYLANQLKGFKAGYRGAKPGDTYGMQMRPMSMTLVDENAISNVAAYIETLNGPVSPPTLDGNAEAGKGLYATCVACHGADGKGNQALNSPSLVGLQDWYIVRQLKNFKGGIRGTHPEDVYGQTMYPMSMTLADEKAMKDVAAYIISLRK